MFVEFSFYSRHLEEIVCVEAEIDYKQPEPNNDVSDHDNYGGFIINTIELYSQGSNPQRIYATSEKQRELLDLEVRAQLNKHVRNLDVETCMYDMDVPFLFGEDE